MADAKAYLHQSPRIPKDSLGDNEQHCSICKEEFDSHISGAQPEHATRLSCNHVFGSECITTWATSHNSCPTCRSTIVSTVSHSWDTEEEEDDDDDGWMRTSGERRLSNDLREHLQRLLYRAAVEIALEDPGIAGTEDGQSAAGPWVLQGSNAFLLTLSRERLLYQDLRDSGVALPSLQCPDNIGTDHEDALFHALEAMEIFDVPWQGFRALADRRETFQVMREEGFVWDLNEEVEGRQEKGAWVGLCVTRGDLAYVPVS